MAKGCQSQHPAVSSSGTRTDAAQKDKTKAAPSGHAVRDTQCSGQAQTTTTVVNSHGLKRRANCNTSPYRAWIHIYGTATLRPWFQSVRETTATPSGSLTSQTWRQACRPGGLALLPSGAVRRCGVPPTSAATSRTARSKNPSLSPGRGHWGHRRTPLPSSTRRMGRRANLPRRRVRSTLLHFAARRCWASAERRCRCPPWRPFRWAPREPRRLRAPREPRRLVTGAESKKGLLHGGRKHCRRWSTGGGGGGLASPETHHPPHPCLAQIFQQCIPRAPSLDFRSGLRASKH